MSVDPRRVQDGVVPANGWHRLDGELEETCNAGDDAMHEITVHYGGDDGRYAEETYYVAPNRAGRLSVWQMSYTSRWRADDPEHVGEPIFEDYTYDCLGLFDYEDDEQGMADALKVRDRHAAGDESDSYTY